MASYTVVLPKTAFERWLDVGVPVESMIDAAIYEGLTARPVSRLLNNVRIDDASILDPRNEPKPAAALNK